MMQQFITAVFLLAATGSLASLQTNEADNSIREILQNQAIECSQTAFFEGIRETKGPNGAYGPYSTVETELDTAVGQ